MLLSPGMNSNVDIRMKTKRLFFLVVVVHDRGENDGILRNTQDLNVSKYSRTCLIMPGYLSCRDNFNYLETGKSVKIIKEHKNLLAGQRKSLLS